MKKSHPLIAPAAALALLAAPIAPLVQAETQIYEPFDYTTTGNTDNDGFYLGDGNQSGALGLSSSWAQTTTDIEMEVTDGGLTFMDGTTNGLQVSGNSILRSSRFGSSALSSAITPAATAALTADNTTMWMSFLYVDTGFSGPDSSVMLASQPLALGENHTLGSAGYSVGILIGENTTDELTSAVETGYYLNSTIPTRSTSSFYPGAAGTDQGPVCLLAAKINWKPDGTPDEIFVFNITDLTTEPLESEAIASATFDMPLTAQQSLNTLNIGEAQIDGFDEIRFGTSFADVAPYIPAAPGTIYVYESFDYTAGAAIVGQNGGTGFDGAWTGAGTTGTTIVGTGLSFGSLSVAGGSDLRSDRAGAGAISRTITGTAQAALTADNSTIWFSVLMDPTGGNGYSLNTYGTLIFGDTAFTSASGTSAPTLTGGSAFGVGFAGHQVATLDQTASLVDIQGVVYNNGTLTQSRVGTPANNTEVGLSGDYLPNVGNLTSLIVGRIDFAPTDSNDTLRLYHVTDPGLSLPAAPFAIMTADLDQSNFNVISIGDAQTSIFDEIRIGTSYAAVVYAPSLANPAITAFTSVGGNV